MDFNLVTNSGQTLSQTRDFLVDTEVGNWWIDYDESSNIFGTFVSGQTNIEFHFEERMSNFCVNHSNPDVNQGCWSNTLQATWALGGNGTQSIIVASISITDELGNTASQFLNFNYSNEAPTLVSSNYTISQPGWVEFDISHHIPVNLSIAEGNNSQNRENNSAYFGLEGVFLEDIIFTDRTGNILLASNMSVIVDSTSPDIEMEISHTFRW